MKLEKLQVPSVRRASAAVLMAVAVGAAIGQSQLAHSELSALIVGKTVEYKYHPDGRTASGYFAPDGTYWYQRSDGGVFDGVWRNRNDGTLCISFATEECGPVSRDANGGYSRAIGGGAAVKWTKISSGRTF